MNWQEAHDLIIQNISVGTRLSEESEYRVVQAGPNHECSTYDYNGALGYSILIGASSRVEIPISMLEFLFNDSTENDGIYNRAVFQNRFERQLINHGCHVHVVGKIFELSGVANKNGNNFHLQ